MKVGFEAKRVFQNFTGLGNYSRSLIDNLIRFHEEVEAHLFAPKIASHPRVKHLLLKEQIHVHAAPYFFKSYWRSFGMSATVAQQGMDVFHGLSHELPYGLRKRKIKQVVTVHDVIWLHFPEYYSSVDRQIFTTKLRHAAKEADKIIAISKQTARDVEKYFKVPSERIEVVYQTCDHIFWNKLNIDQDLQVKYNLPAEYILYVGSIIKRKRLSLIIQALALIPTKDRPSLVIIGRGGKYEQKVRKMVVKLGVSASVIFLENAQFMDLPALYAQARVTVYPSDFEGFGLPVLESLVCGTPVITTNRSSLPEAGGRGAHLLEEGTPEELAYAISRLIHDEAYHDQLRKGGEIHAEAFQPEQVTSDLWKVYEGLA